MLNNKSNLDYQINDNFFTSRKHHIKSIRNRNRIRNFCHYIRNLRRNFHLVDRIRIIYLFREFFRIVSTLLITRSFSSIYSIAFIFQSESCTKVIVISSQKVLTSRFNISSTHQHRSYFLCSRVNSKVYLSTFTYQSFFSVSTIVSVSISKIAQSSIRIQYSLCLNTEIIYLFRKHCEIISISHQQELRLFFLRDELNINSSKLYLENR